MTLSTSRQQFLAYETQGMDEIQYNRKGGIFVSTCVCIGYILLATIIASLVGVIVYFVTSYKLSQKTTEFWNEAEPFGQTAPNADLRLPSTVEPSFYRLKIKANLDNSSFTGEVSITIRANKKTKEIILHSKGLSIKSSAKLTEQIYEKVDSIHTRSKRRVDSNETTENNTVTVASNVTSEAPVDLTDEAVFVTETPVNKTTAVNTVTVSTTTTTKVPVSDVPVDAHTQVTHSSVRNIKIISIIEGARDRLVLTLASALKPDVDYILELSFEGKISNSLTGFYKSTYTNNENEVKNLGVTQFEATSARAAFPCFDEPAFKAKFEISIAHPKNITVLSNMKVSTQEFIADEPDWQWTHFDRSVKMSTYLVAYTLTDFKPLETSYISKDNVTKPIRIWTRPELINKAKYASTITPRLLEYYENVFGLPYALDKLDLIAIPDFSSGAMENWGLITFRETTLLFDEVESVPLDKQNVAIDVAHELAHQWFGNLVTMRWWTDLWLNEGFATYIEYVGVDHIEPDWNMLESFTRDKMDLLRSDALKNTSPVSRQVVDASEISQKFDEISYIKGANLIRMLNHTMTEELFHKGLMNYLNQWKYSNAEENDLWQAMSSAGLSNPALEGHSLVDFMNSWTRQAGYPVVDVNRNYDSGDVKFEQRLFSSSSEPYKKRQDQIWQIPVSYTPISAPIKEWSTKPKLWLSERSISRKVDVNSTQALYVNVGAIGYYRVNYDQKNWELLSEALKSGNVKSPVTRAQLIDDAFNLAKASQLNYSLALGLTTYIKDGEKSKIVWDLLLNNMAFLKHNLKTTSGYRYFQDYVRTMLSKQLAALNYGMTKPKDHNEAFLIENLVTWECHVEAPRCLQWAREQFRMWSHGDLNNNTIPSYLRSLVYNMALKHGTREEFDVLWNLFLNSTDPGVKSLVVSNLAATMDESLITMLLEKSLTDIPKQYAVAVWSVEPPVGTAVAQRFLLENFDRVYKRFTEMDEFKFPAVLTGAFGLIATESELNTLKSFAMEHKERLRPMSQTLQKIVDTATLRIDWLKRHAHTINTWFQDYVTGKSSVPNAPVTEAPTNASIIITPTVKPAEPSKNNTNIALNVSHESSPKDTSAEAAAATPPAAANETSEEVTTSSAAPIKENNN